MKIDWTQYTPSDFKNEQFEQLLKLHKSKNREDFWREFFWLFQMGTSSIRTEKDRQQIYQMAYEFISTPEHTRDCLSVRDIETRVRLIRRFPFLTFKDQQNLGRRIWRKLRSR